MWIFSLASTSFYLLGLASAIPTAEKRQSITAASTTQIDSYTPYTWYASTAYCEPSETANWSCGTDCEANPSFKPIASGGDSSDIQYWYVGYDSSLDTVIVAHQGTDTSEILADLTDADFFLENLNESLFPGISSSIECHSGFANEQAKTATEVLAAVKSAMSKYGTTSVTTVGHSLGAAIALLDAVYLPLWLPSSTKFKTIVYGLPRVGNQAFANYIDANATLTHINNEKDPVPILPGMFLGFVHPAGEVHIESSGEWANCPGQDNPSTQCIVGDVPYIWDGNATNHDGPYNGIEMGCSSN